MELKGIRSLPRVGIVAENALKSKGVNTIGELAAIDYDELLVITKVCRHVKSLRNAARREISKNIQSIG